MKAKNAVIAWTPIHRKGYNTIGQVKVGTFDTNGRTTWTKPFASIGGATWIATRSLSHDKAILQVFKEFHTLVVRDGIDPLVAHREFLKIDEYAENIELDIDGAREV